MEEYTVRVFADCTEWLQNGQRHRIGGPAIEWADGTKAWYQNGQRHRTDGPAVEWANGYKEWYIEGVDYTEEEYHNKLSPVKELTVAEVEKLLGHRVKIVKG